MEITNSLSNKYKEYEVNKAVALESIDGKLYEIELLTKGSKFKLALYPDGEILKAHLDDRQKCKGISFRKEVKSSHRTLQPTPCNQPPATSNPDPPFGRSRIYAALRPAT